MSTTASSGFGRSAFYQEKDLKPFANRLAAYTTYALMLLDLRSRMRSIENFNRALRRSPRIRRARSLALSEMQNIYNHVAFGLRLPRIPVRLPLRKRIHAAGLVSHLSISPLQIRIFTFCGRPDKPQHLWLPSDLGIRKPTYVCEILLHEIAHVYQGFYTGEWDHERGFARSYHAVEEVFLGFGFGPLLPETLRFAGCPPGSFATSLQGTPRQSKSLAIGINGDHAAKP